MAHTKSGVLVLTKAEVNALREVHNQLEAIYDFVPNVIETKRVIKGLETLEFIIQNEINEQ